MLARLLAVVVGLVLLSGCSKSGTPAWTVVATQWNVASDTTALRIDYIAPGGKIVRWERPELSLATSSFKALDRGYRDCWIQAKIGEPLPACARSEPTPTPTPSR